MIEIIVVIALITLCLWGILEVAKYGLRVQEQNKAKLRAANLAIEAIEASRSVRDESWDNFASLNLGVKYYPVISGNKWVLTPNNPGLIDGLYGQWIELEGVYRDADDNISSSGTEDPDTRKVNALTEWNDRTGNKRIELTIYLTNWANE